MEKAGVARAFGKAGVKVRGEGDVGVPRVGQWLG